MHFTYVNEQFSAITGYNREALEGNSVRLILGNKLFFKALSELPHFLRTGEVRIPFWEITSKSGARIKAKIDFSAVQINGNTYLLVVPLEIVTSKELEKELEFEKLRLESIAESAQLGFWDVNFNTQEYITNDMWWKMLGYEPHSVEEIDAFFNAILHPVDREQLLKETERIQKGEKSILDFTFRIKSATGNWKWVQTHGNAISFNEDGTIARLVGVHIDVTENKKRDEILEQKELHFKTFTERTPHVIWSSRANGTPFFMNSAGLNFFGVSEEDLKQWLWKEVTTEEEYPLLKEKWETCVEKNLPFEHTHQFRRQDGIYIWFQVTHFPHSVDEQGSITWTSIATNIEKRIQSETKLTVANSRLRSLINASPTAIYSLNKHGFVIDFWNPAAEKIFGWTREEVLGKYPPFLPKEANKNFKDYASQDGFEKTSQIISKRKK